MKIIKNAKVYSPEYIGKKDILITGNTISQIADLISLNSTTVEHEVIDIDGRTLIPGLIDQHVHVTGGGGEGGFSSRIAPIGANKLALGGVTTVLGLLGTDGTTRNVADLFGHTNRLCESGLTAFMLTGSYEYPTVTLTGSVKQDIIFIDRIIGVKTAISDHRASFMTYAELANLASISRTAGMISGKAGIVTIHMGDGDDKLNMIYEVLKKTSIPIKHFVPTHLNRNSELMAESVKYGKMGGYLDYSAVPLKEEVKDITAGTAVKYALENKVSEDLITMSSDGNGSWSTYDEAGKLKKIGSSNPQDLFAELRHLVINKVISIETALKAVTSNPARVIGLYPKKGTIMEQSDADMIIIDSDFNVESVIAKGRFLVKEGIFNPAKPIQNY
ncbi:MAG TPA: beta-aspartyl-peptidase [Lentisphaeria bacterium]|nr:beta-aspartyl-peptidase [Lentisphaeria bacterium]